MAYDYFSKNLVIIVGNMGDDPDVRDVGDSVVAGFSVATTIRWGDDGEKTEWHRIKCWGNLAEIVEKYFQKGNKVYVEGRNETESWEDDDGVKHYRTKINATDIIKLDRDDDGGSRRGRNRDDDDDDDDRGRSRNRGRGNSGRGRSSGRGSSRSGGRDSGRSGSRSANSGRGRNSDRGRDRDDDDIPF